MEGLEMEGACCEVLLIGGEGRKSDGSISGGSESWSESGSSSTRGWRDMVAVLEMVKVGGAMEIFDYNWKIGDDFVRGVAILENKFWRGIFGKEVPEMNYRCASFKR